METFKMTHGCRHHHLKQRPDIEPDLSIGYGISAAFWLKEIQVTQKECS